MNDDDVFVLIGGGAKGQACCAHLVAVDGGIIKYLADDLPLARIVLEETKRASYRLIWENEMSEMFRSAAKHTSPALSELEKTPPPEPENSEAPEPETAKTEVEVSC
jgi:hypothetical protein